MARSVDYKIIQDTSPTLEGVLRDSNGSPFDLTDYTLYFTWFNSDTGVQKDDIICVSDDPTNGVYKVPMTTTNTDKDSTPAGLWYFQFTAINGSIVHKWPLKDDDEIDNFGSLLVAKNARISST